MMMLQDNESGLELCGLDYLNYWLHCIHAFTASYSTCSVAAPSSGVAVVGRLYPVVFVVGTNRAALHDDADQQLRMVRFSLYDSRRYCCTIFLFAIYVNLMFNFASAVAFLKLLM